MNTTTETPDERMWREIKARLKATDFAKVTWEAVYRAKQALDYDLNEWEWEALRRTSPNVTPIVTPRKDDDGEDWWQR